MRKRGILLLFGIPVAVVAIVALVMVLTRAREPEYGGKKLGEWVLRYRLPPASPFPSRTQFEAREAIRNIGTNGIPYLLGWIAYDQPGWRGRVDRAVWRLKLPWPAPDRRVALAIAAGRAFEVFGPEASSSIWTLIQIASNPKRDSSRVQAVAVLRRLGKPAMPALVTVVTNQEFRVGKWMEAWGAAAQALGYNSALDRETALSAVPELLSMAKDRRVGAWASIALNSIDPEALKKATVNH